jgi:hypothetical protein
MQLTEDHTLLARLLAAGIDVDTSGDGARFRSMLTNALGIGSECRISIFLLPLAEGDRLMLCTDGISEYVGEAEVGQVLISKVEPEPAAQRLVELALERGGSDNATALVVRVDKVPSGRTLAQHQGEREALEACPLFAKLSAPQRLRARRIALGRELAKGERLPAQTLGDRVAWVIVEGSVERGAEQLGKSALAYPESLLDDRQLERDQLWIASTEVRALALRANDFRELCEDDAELGEALLESLGKIAKDRGK